jgi:hypothetical protein
MQIVRSNDCLCVPSQSEHPTNVTAKRLSRGSINGVNAWYFDFGTFNRAITGITVIAFNEG